MKQFSTKNRKRKPSIFDTSLLLTGVMIVGVCACVAAIIHFVDQANCIQ